MTREAMEAMGIKVLEQEPFMNKPCVAHQVCHEDKIKVLDMIRAEIKTKYDSIPWRNNDYDDGWIEALEWVFDDVIDKYRAESEDKE